MKKNALLIICTLGFLLTGTNSKAQGIIDGFSIPKGDLSITASYLRSTYDKFYVGDKKTSPVPAHKEIDQDIYDLYAKFGLTEKLSLIANVPYISANGKGAADPVNGETEQSGFQDISLFAKYKPYRLGMATSNFDLITALGFNIPTGYEPNGILSLGSGAFTTDLHLGLQFNTEVGFFSSFIAGYSFRGKAKNTFKTNGGSDFDVPNAFLATGKIGYAGSKFYIEGWIDYQSSTDGVDIIGPGFKGNFPETEVDYTRMGVTAYVPLSELIGVSAGYGKLIDGRNIGIPENFNFGITFNIHTKGSNTGGQGMMNNNSTAPVEN